jgi:membrane fusion protein (multidrug efflux system)
VNRIRCTKTAWTTLAAVLMLAGLFQFAGCKKKDVIPPLQQVEVADVIQQDVPVTQEWVGTLQGSVNADIRPKIEGYILKQLYLEGSVVKQGQPLFQIDPRQFKAALDSAKGNLSRNEAALENANIKAERYTPLAKSLAISQQELDDALSDQRQCQANVETAKAQLEQAQLNLSWTTVTSPIAGIAGTVQIQVGSLVNGQSVLTTVSTVDPIRVAFGLNEQQYLNYMAAEKKYTDAIKDRLEIILSDGSVYPYKGRLIIINRQVDVKTGTITAEGEFPNPDNLLRPGQYAKVRVVTFVKEGALLVPQAAVKELQGDTQVAVVGPDGIVDMRSVTPAERVGTLWVIDKGIKPGEKVVVGGLQLVRSGMKVQAVSAPPAGEAPAEKAPAAGSSAAGAPAGGR